MYILKTDYIGRIAMSLLDILIEENPEQIIADTGKDVEDTIRTMAGVLYDINPELLKAGNLRNGYILSLAKSLGIYFIYQRADDEQIPEKVIKNYDDAMEELQKISVGKLALDLPPKPKEPSGGEGSEGTETEGSGLRRMGSQKKRTHQI